jgi:parvulin-like peptidyl-prolyl isomerase
MIMNFFTKQVGEQLVQQQILLAEADRLGIGATNDDVANYLHSGPTGAVIFPNGKFIGDQQYTALVNTRLNISVAEFEENIKRDIVLQRLRAMVTASISVSGQEVRDTYRKENTRIKFDYAVIASDDLRKTINPADDSLEAYFKKNAARYANAVPEQRKISYFAFTPSQLPGGIPQASQQDIQSYYTAHQAEYQSPETATSRHILIKLAPNADPKADAAAKAKAEDVLKQVQNGGNFADLAKKYSDDPGSKDSGGELGPSQRGRMVPEFDSAIFTQKIGDTKVVKSQFGYHIVQVESRQPAHLQALNEVLPTIPGRRELREAPDVRSHQERSRKDGGRAPPRGRHDASGGSDGRNLGSARRIAALVEGVPIQGGRSGAVRAHRRRLCHLPGDRDRRGSRAYLCRLEDPRTRRLSQRATSGSAEPEDQGTRRQGPGVEGSGQGSQASGRHRQDQRPGWTERPGSRTGTSGAGSPATLRHAVGRDQRTDQRGSDGRSGQAGRQAATNRCRNPEELRPTA